MGLKYDHNGNEINQIGLQNSEILMLKSVKINPRTELWVFISKTHTKRRNSTHFKDQLPLFLHYFIIISHSLVLYSWDTFYNWKQGLCWNSYNRILLVVTVNIVLKIYFSNLIGFCNKGSFSRLHRQMNRSNRQNNEVN